MVEEFKELSEQEIEVLMNAPVLVSVLMAGADDKIDKKEKNLAISLAKMKTYRARKILVPYYNALHSSFEERMNSLINDMPVNASERNPIIENELAKLNDILPKLDQKFSIQFYESLKDFAKQVAEASGGILGYLSVNVDESKFLNLKMIQNPDKG
jgi:hypothetical protein